MRTEVCTKANLQLDSCMYGSEELVANNVHGARRLWEGEPPSYFNHMLGRRATPIHTGVLFVQSRVSCTILGKRMCVFKLYLDSLLSVQRSSVAKHEMFFENLFMAQIAARFRQ